MSIIKKADIDLETLLIQRLVNGSMDKLLVDQKIRSESDIEKINKEIEFKELKREKVIKLRQINNLYKKD